MGWWNPPVRWSQLERHLSDRPEPAPPGADGGDNPAWTPKRGAYRPPTDRTRPAPVGPRYAELHCHSHFSFLDGSSSPEELVEEAARLGLCALALTDHDGLYGAVRFSEAARTVGLPTVFGAELSVGLTKPQTGRTDPEGRHLLVVARSPDGYRRLCRAISQAQMAGGQKGRPVYDLDDLGDLARGEWLWLTGCRKGTVPAALIDSGPVAARRELLALTELAGGRDHVGVELWNHGHPLDSARNDALAEIAATAGVACVATNNAHYHSPSRHRLANAVAAVRARRCLDDIDGWLPASPTAHLRSGAEQTAWFRRYRGVVEQAARWGTDCAFDLSLIAPNLPRFPCPPGLDETGYLRCLTATGADDRYGPAGQSARTVAQARLDHELEVIEQLGWPGYFLIVWDMIRFCNDHHIYVQGRGSAVGCAVCYTLGITSIDPVARGLLFERFLSDQRGTEPPDIDLDIESDRREELIQYVYGRYGRDCAAQVANVISYRARSAIKDMAKALGYSTGQQDAWSKQIEHRDLPSPAGRPGDVGAIPDAVLDLAGQLEHAPRHLGIHSGGMVLADRPIAEVCPIEWARRENRTVLQWDKDDCQIAGLVKIDLLGLGMLSAIHYAIELVNQTHGTRLALHTIPAEDPAVYDMLGRADAIGVFQIESRAQMQTLPRMRPRCFYDLAVQIAIIRPGPIQGGSVHPYLRRRNHEEPATYLHPLLVPVLERTLGIPLFQEQLMEIAQHLGGFSAGEADELRRAMGSKRSRERMAALKDRLYAGMAARNIDHTVADQLWAKLAAFSDYGFPESHALAFAHLAYVSSWLKRYYPAGFCAGLLNAQPMGFYSPHSLVRDARRHGVTVSTPDINASDVHATLETDDTHQPVIAPRHAPPTGWGKAGPAVRLGLAAVQTIGDDLAARVVDERHRHGPYTTMEDLARRVTFTLPQLEALATAGAFAGLGVDRRQALWAAGAVAQARPDRLPGIIGGATPPTLPAMTDQQEAHADLWATGVSPDGHPTRFARPHLDTLGVTPNDRLADLPDGTKIVVAGIVTHRQRPATAGGMVFLNLEDETGMVNVVCSPGFWVRYRQSVLTSPALLVHGRLQNRHHVINVVAEQAEPLPLTAPSRSRDFR